VTIAYGGRDGGAQQSPWKVAVGELADDGEAELEGIALEPGAAVGVAVAPTHAETASAAIKSIAASRDIAPPNGAYSSAGPSSEPARRGRSD
jgi:hypothetical protein